MRVTIFSEIRNNFFKFPLALASSWFSTLHSPESRLQVPRKKRFPPWQRNGSDRCCDGQGCLWSGWTHSQSLYWYKDLKAVFLHQKRTRYEKNRIHTLQIHHGSSSTHSHVLNNTYTCLIIQSARAKDYNLHVLNITFVPHVLNITICTC